MKISSQSFDKTLVFVNERVAKGVRRHFIILGRRILIEWMSEWCFMHYQSINLNFWFNLSVSVAHPKLQKWISVTHIRSRKGSKLAAVYLGERFVSLSCVTVKRKIWKLVLILRKCTGSNRKLCFCDFVKMTNFLTKKKPLWKRRKLEIL